MRERRKQYPELYPDWENTTRECRERANNHCEHCGCKQFTIKISAKGNPYFIYLVGAHVHQLDTANLNSHEPINGQSLMCLCPSCHGTYDAYWRRIERGEPAKTRKPKRDRKATKQRRPAAA